MLRYILIAFVIYSLISLWRRMSARKPAGPAKEIGKPGEMVACSRCGTFVLRSEAVENGPSIFCSDKCHRGGT